MLLTEIPSFPFFSSFSLFKIQCFFFFQLRCPSSSSRNRLYPSLCFFSFLLILPVRCLPWTIRSWLFPLLDCEIRDDMDSGLIHIVSSVLNTVHWQGGDYINVLSNWFKLKDYISEVGLNKFPSSYILGCQ